jgi:hypothetical protein
MINSILSFFKRSVPKSGETYELHDDNPFDSINVKVISVKDDYVLYDTYRNETRMRRGESCSLEMFAYTFKKKRS